MYNLWPLFIILVAFLVIIFIIFRRFPALAVLDVNNIPEEKEQRIKEKIIRERMRRKFSFLDNFFNKVLDSFNKVANIFWLKIGKIKTIKKEQQDEKSLSQVSSEDKIKILFSAAEDFIKKENWLEAEKKLIEIISIDDKNFLAFFELGEVYHSEEKWQEAKQTLLYAVKLAEISSEKISPSDFSNLNYSLALINKELNNFSEAISNLDKALEIDPKNPRYLDLMLNLCIIKKDKSLAIKFLDRIKKSNPENNNISKWEEDVRLLEF